MKKTLILLSLCFSMNLYADFETGLALGLIMSPSSDNVTVVKDEFTTQIEIIERGIPNSFNDENPKLEYIAYVDEVSKDRYLNYFKNKGYQVNYNKGKITFDLTKHFEYFKKSQETNKKILVYFFTHLVL